jgi:hypothetical protein
MSDLVDEGRSMKNRRPVFRVKGTAVALVFLLALSVAGSAAQGAWGATASEYAGEGAGTPYGQGNQLFGMHLQPQLADQYEQAFSKMQEVGVMWARTNMGWYQLEPNEGQFDWTGLDGQVASAKSHGMRLLVTVRAISPWGSSQLPPDWNKPGYHATYPPKDINQYSAFISALATHFRNDGIAWQIENEPNSKSFWGGTQQEYIALLEAGYSAAHQADQDAVVLSAGLACGFSKLGKSSSRLVTIQQWFNAILDSHSFDAVDMHDYYLPEDNNAWGLTFQQYIDAHKSWMQSKGIDVPMWISEAGVNSQSVTFGKLAVAFTQQQQADDLRRIYDTARTEGVVHVFWLKLVDTKEDAFSYMGLVSSDDQHKPSWGIYLGLANGNKVPATPTWYLAEGTTAWGFSCYISIENPNATTVHAAITYMTASGQVSGGTVTLPAKSQATVNPASTLGAKDFSTRVVCTEGETIAVDRTMTWTGPGAASSEAHSSVGVTAPAATWYLPEGSSAWGFDCWLLIQNPNAGKATCSVTYMIEGGSPKTVTKTINPSSRSTFNIADDIGQKNASIKVAADVPVIPERAMYRNNKREGHDSIGTTTPASDYYLAEGTTAWGFTTYVLVQNPNANATDVTVTYMTTSGAKAQAPFSLAANSRKTIRVNDVAGMGGTDFSTKVHGNQPIIAERAMYLDNGTGEACHDSIGMASAHTTFYLPDGDTSGGCETWTLVQNPNSTSVTVEISYLTPSGAGNVVKTATIPASSRQTFGMLSHSGINGRASIMVTSKTSGKKIMVERAMYWNNRGAGTDTIGGFSD